MGAASDERVLSYGDVLLRQSDVSLLDEPNFLNDHIIEFFFNYLSRQYCSSSGSQPVESSPLLLVGPTLTFWLLHCPDSEGLMAAIDPMRFAEREMVIFALNNNEDVETAEGGTHWTLLMYNRVRNTFEHFDSMAGTNWKQARDLVDIIKPYMGPPYVSRSIDRRVDAVSVACLPTSVSPNIFGCCGDSSVAVEEGAGVSNAKFIEQATPQQENNYDCGVYVMAIAQVLCTAFHERKRSRSLDYAGLVRTSVNSTSVNRMRYTTLDLIHSLSSTDEDTR